MGGLSWCDVTCTFVYCSIRCCFVRFAFIVCYVCDWYTKYWGDNGEWVPFGTGPFLRLNIPRFLFLVSHWILCALDGKHYFLNWFIFLCVVTVHPKIHMCPPRNTLDGDGYGVYKKYLRMDCTCSGSCMHGLGTVVYCTPGKTRWQHRAYLHYIEWNTRGAGIWRARRVHHCNRPVIRTGYWCQNHYRHCRGRCPPYH